MVWVRDVDRRVALALGALLLAAVVLGVGSSSSQGAAATREPSGGPAVSAAQAPQRFVGNYETGDLSQWNEIQRAAPARISVVRSPRAQGRFSARFEARRGEYVGGDSKARVNRSEVAIRDRSPAEGEERWYRWHTRLARRFPVVPRNDFLSLMQWKRVDNRNPLPLGFGIRGRRLRIASNGTMYLGRITPGVWHRFVVHARWSSDARRGFFEIWMDGRRIVKRTARRNIWKAGGQAIPHYIKQGLYKGDATPSTYVHHDGFVMAESRAALGR